MSFYTKYFNVVYFSCHVVLLTDVSHAFHRSVLCDDDPPWCHSDRHTTNHRPTHTVLSCVSISLIIYLDGGIWCCSVRHRYFWKQTNCWSALVEHLLYSMQMLLEIDCLVMVADRLWSAQVKFESEFWLLYKSATDSFLMFDVKNHSVINYFNNNTHEFSSVALLLWCSPTNLHKLDTDPHQSES